MKPSKVLLISVFLTAVILVVVGVVTTSIILNDKATETQIKYNQLIEQSVQREVQYQQLIVEANQKLEKANNDLLAMQSQFAQVQGPQQSKTATASMNIGAAISPEKAGY